MITGSGDQVQPGIGEKRDDGNTTPGDGCSVTCQIESAGQDLPALGPRDTAVLLGVIAGLGLAAARSTLWRRS